MGKRLQTITHRGDVNVILTSHVREYGLTTIKGMINIPDITKKDRRWIQGFHNKLGGWADLQDQSIPC